MTEETPAHPLGAIREALKVAGQGFDDVEAYKHIPSKKLRTVCREALALLRTYIASESDMHGRVIPELPEGWRIANAGNYDCDKEDSTAGFCTLVKIPNDTDNPVYIYSDAESITDAITLAVAKIPKGNGS